MKNGETNIRKDYDFPNKPGRKIMKTMMIAAFCHYVSSVNLTQVYIGLQMRYNRQERPKNKKGNLPRFPIFINLKSNTMKNTVQR